MYPGCLLFCGFQFMQMMIKLGTALTLDQNINFYPLSPLFYKHTSLNNLVRSLFDLGGKTKSFNGISTRASALVVAIMWSLPNCLLKPSRIKGAQISHKIFYSSSRTAKISKNGIWLHVTLYLRIFSILWLLSSLQRQDKICTTLQHTCNDNSFMARLF